jgi:NADPH:quinone reductase-like Zn-dependent oxidoreductase
MHAAVVTRYGDSPKYGEFPNEPAAGPDEVIIHVKAAALSNLVRGQASGQHYSSGNELPLIPGNDGVGTLEDGRRVYFVGPRAPFGSMAERTVIDRRRIIPLPDDLDDITAAALGNPGLATWGSLLGRAKLQPGETVLVNGATGAAGQQAIQAARFLGAKRIVATGRNEPALKKLQELGADEVIALGSSDDALHVAFARELRDRGVDVVLDYLWGHSAELLLQAAAGRGSPQGESRIRYVQIGAISGATIALNGGWLRSSGVELLGSGLGSLPAKDIISALTRMFASAREAGLKIDTLPVPLSQVETAWTEDSCGRRIVFTI